MEKKEVMSQLLKKGGELVKGLKVKNVTVTPQENWVRVGLTLDKEVKSMTTEDGVDYVEGTSKVILVSMYSILPNFRENDDMCFAVDYIRENPDSLKVLLSNSTIDIIQEPVTEGEEYINPWSENADPKTIDHNTIYNHITSLTLNERGLKYCDKIADKLMGF